MPDISMCQNESCSMKQTCYRYKAKPNKYRQTYTDFKETVKNGGCDHYWKY